MGAGIYFWQQECNVGNSSFCGGMIFLGAEIQYFVQAGIFLVGAGRKEAAYRGPADVGLLTCTSTFCKFDLKYLKYLEI